MKKITSVAVVFLLLITMVNFSAYCEGENGFYVVLGDSIAYGSGLNNPQEACYGKIVADTIGYDYVNHAVPGHTSSDLLSKISEEAVISDIEKADIISISIGGNDFLKNNPSDLIFDAALEDDYSGFDLISEAFFNNLTEIIGAINSKNPDAVIILQTLYNPQTDELGELYQHGVDGINGMLVKYSEENPGEIEIADVYEAFDGDLSNVSKDGIHPSAKGNRLIAYTILDKLTEIGICSSAEPVITEEGEDIAGSLLRNIAVKMLVIIVKILAYFYHLAV